MTEPVRTSEQHLCATCDEIVGEDHPNEWMCSAPLCGVWFHVGGDDRCPECGSEPL